jgi:four helix bundle protein
MDKLKRFEDLIAWQKARLLAREIYRVAQIGKFSRDYGLTTQITKAAVSIMSNIAEGFERGKRGEFEHFLSIAKGSCAEVRSQLYVALDVGYLQEDGFNALLHQAEEVGKIIGGLRVSVAQQRRSA